MCLYHLICLFQVNLLSRIRTNYLNQSSEAIGNVMFGQNAVLEWRSHGRIYNGLIWFVTFHTIQMVELNEIVNYPGQSIKNKKTISWYIYFNWIFILLIINTRLFDLYENSYWVASPAIQDIRRTKTFLWNVLTTWITTAAAPNVDGSEFKSPKTNIFPVRILMRLLQ